MEINVIEMMKKIREDIRNKGEGYYDVNILGDTNEKNEEEFYEIMPLNPEFEQYLYQVNQTWNIKLEDDTHTGIVKRQLKKIVRRLLGFAFFPMYEKQKMFNAECVRALNALADEIRQQNAELRQLKMQITVLEDKIVNQ